MEIEVRLATAHDRKALDEFYAREGMDFKTISSRAACYGSTETMFIVAAVDDIVVAAMKLDIARSPSLGRVGYIQYFEIEDKLESTDLGKRMLDKVIELAEEKNLSALDTMIKTDRSDLISIYMDKLFEIDHKEVYLRRKFKASIF